MNRVNRAISPRNVVSALAARKSHVPLRDSKLTRSQSMPNKPNEPNDWAFHLCFLGPSALKFAEFVASPGSWTVLWWQLPHCFAGLREPSLWACHGPQSCANCWAQCFTMCRVSGWRNFEHLGVCISSHACGGRGFDYCFVWICLDGLL